MNSVSKNVYIDKVDHIDNRYNNTYHSTINMKPVDVKLNAYIASSKEINNTNPKFKISDTVRTSKYKIFLQKVTLQIGQKKFLWLKKVKNRVLCAYVNNDLNGEEIVWTFYENELQKTNQKEFRIEKVIKIKGDKLYVKWKG